MYDIEVPVKPGQTLYRVLYDRRVNEPHEVKVTGLWIGMVKAYSSIYVARFVDNKFDYSLSFPFSELGKSLFETYDEAKKIIDERK